MSFRKRVVDRVQVTPFCLPFVTRRAETYEEQGDEIILLSSTPLLHTTCTTLCQWPIQTILHFIQLLTYNRRANITWNGPFFSFSGEFSRTQISLKLDVRIWGVSDVTGPDKTDCTVYPSIAKSWIKKMWVLTILKRLFIRWVLQTKLIIQGMC